MAELRMVISGGQNGADIAGLETADRFGIKTGGWMPFGYKTLDGPRPGYRKRFGMKMKSSSSYAVRTSANVEDSDGTIRFAADFESPGEICTLKAISRKKKEHFDVDLVNPPPVADVVKWLEEKQIEVLNVAGNSENTFPGCFKKTCDYLAQLFESLGFKPRQDGVEEHMDVSDEETDNHEGAPVVREVLPG